MVKKNWKTTLFGWVFAVATLFGPRLSGDMTAPPITLDRVIAAAAVAALGTLSKDHDVTGGTKPQQ